ncbi:MAG: ABC transporter permease [Acidobacteriota bacterium]|jgi:predicted permease
MSRPSRGERLYRLLLHAYPPEFRHACEDELIGYFRSDACHPRYRGALGRLRFWRHTLHDWARTAWSERRSGGAAPGGPATGPERPRTSGGTSPFRHAARGLRRDPAFLAVAVATLAIGMSATTVVFALVNGLLLTPLPLPHPERLIQVEERQRDNPGARMAAYGNWVDVARDADTLENLAVYAYDTKTLTGIDAAQRLRSREVSANFFSAIGVAPILGRNFEPEEFVDGGQRVVALSHALWHNALGADEKILGRTIQLDATPYTVVAVMPPGFDFPEPADIWVPLVPPAVDRMRRAHRYRMVGRLADGVDVERAQQSLNVIGARLEREFPDTNQGDFYAAYPLLDDYVGEARPVLRMLSGAVGLVLLIACVNIAGLSLARASARRHEMAMRRALGANRRQLAGLVASEGLLLGVIAGLLGVPLSLGGLRLLLGLAGSQIPRADNVAMSAGVFGFAAVVSVLTGLLVSLLPLLRESGTGAAAVVGSRVASERSAVLGRRALAVAEIAFAVVLVAGAALLGRSLLRLTAVPIGVQSDGVLTMSIALPNGKYPQRIDTARFFNDLLPEIETLPGIERASVTLTEPANPFGWYNSLTIRGRDVPENELPAVSYVVVSSGYFETLDIPLIAGRGLTPADDESGSMVAVLNRTAAERYWPDSSPLGAHILGNPGDEESWARVVGVVEDVHQSLYDPVNPEVYVPVAQDRVLSFVLMARADGDPLQHGGAVRDLIRAADPDIPITRVMTLDDRIGERSADARISAGLMSAFGAVALALAAVGVYGVLSYSVSLRRREFGVRAAIGATRARVVRQVLREALLIGSLAVATGIAVALLLGRFIAGMLFEIDSSDPLTLTAVGVTVAVVTVIAALAPAWRAASTDPLAVLRSE